MVVLAGGAYCGLAPVPGGRLNVGIVLAGRAWRDRLARDGAAATGEHVLRSVPPLPGDPEAWREGTITDAIAGREPARRRVARRAGPDWLVVGDAAGFLDPFTGEGLHRALVSARLAADAIDAHLRGEPGRPRPRTTARCATGSRRRTASRCSSRPSSGTPALFEHAARRLARKARHPCDDGPRDGRPRPRVPRVRPAVPRRAPRPVTREAPSGAIPRATSSAPRRRHPAGPPRRLRVVRARRRRAARRASPPTARAPGCGRSPAAALDFGEDPVAAPSARCARRRATTRRRRPPRRPVGGARAGRDRQRAPDPRRGHPVPRRRVTGGDAARRVRGLHRRGRLGAARGARRPPVRRPAGVGAPGGGPLSVRSTIGIDVAAPPDLVYRLARDVTRWERLLPHYSRSVVRARGRRRRACLRLRRAAAVRARARASASRSPGAAGPGTSPRPGACASSTSAGATRGMDVTWTIEAAGAGRTRVEIVHDFRPRVPGLRGVRRRGLHPADRRPHAGDVRALAEALATSERPDGRRSRRHEPRVPQPRDRPAARSGSPASASSRPSASGCRRSGPGCAASASPGEAHRPLRPVRLPLPGRGTGRRLRARRPHGRRAPCARSTASASSASRPGAWRWPTPGSCPGAAGARRRRAHRDLPRLRARRHRVRGEPARDLPRPRAARRLPHPRARRLRRCGAGEPRHRARRPRADPLDGELVRLGGRGDRRGAEGDPRRRDRRRGRGRRGVPAVAARVRGLRPDPRPRPRLQRRPGPRRAPDGRRPRRLRHGRGRGACS